MTDLITKVENKYMKKDVPPVEPGDSVRVQMRIATGGGDEQATRIHTFAGTVIACKGGGINRSITVRRVTYGIGVERTFPLHSPAVVDVEIVRRGQVSRAKLYYLRDRHERAARLKERREVAAEDTSVADTEEAATALETEAVASEPEVGEEPEAQTDEEPETDTADESRDETAEQTAESTTESEAAESPEVSEESSEDTDT
ncbi:MAG: 50S ribosomal protein L19 [Armatimonadetes bacterium]|nr:50S ribosomal protein L19 [Armatimonadota bacterium]